MNWFMVATAVTQYSAALYGWHLGTPRLALMNALVATANLVLAGGNT